jgi:hypothetical protein
VRLLCNLGNVIRPYKFLTNTVRAQGFDTVVNEGPSVLSSAVLKDAFIVVREKTAHFKVGTLLWVKCPLRVL